MLTTVNVNFHDPEELAEVHCQDEERAAARIKEAVRELKEKGIIDENGNLLIKELPADMQAGSGCTLD